MKKGLKYFTSACGSGNGNFLRPLGFTSTEKLDEADVIVFGGGGDIVPSTYGEEPSSVTYDSAARERVERADFVNGMKKGKHFIGLCRGAQFLTAMAGGKLIQDVSGHHGDHEMTTFDGLNLRVNSIHHQMCNPYAIKNPKDYKILGWTSKRISDRYIGARDKPVFLPWNFKEIEAVYYPKIKGLGIQSHPEMMYGSKYYAPTVEWVQNIFMKIFENRL